MLKDDKKRAAYDKYGSASQQPGFDANAYENARSAYGGSPFGFGFQDMSGMFGGARRGGPGDNLFEQLFRGFPGANAGAGGMGGQAFSRGADIEATVGVSFMEACKGTKRSIPITPIVKCNTCSGTGLKTGATRSTCGDCNGAGTKTYVVSGFHMETTCNSCQGTGSVIPPSGECRSCGGAGQVKVKKNIEVSIPAGEYDRILSCTVTPNGFSSVRRGGRHDPEGSWPGRCVLGQWSSW